MNIEKYLEDINSCRFCFMCRHLSATAQATGSEAYTPRGCALIADSIRMDKKALDNADFIQTIFRADLSGACRKNCNGQYDANKRLVDEIGLKVALRQDIVAAGKAPAEVVALAGKMKKMSVKVAGKGSVLYYEQGCVQATAPEVIKAFQKAVKDAATITGPDGLALHVMGYEKDALAQRKAFVDAVKASGAKTLVVSTPAAYWWLKPVVKSAKVVLSSEYLLGLKPKKGKTVKAAFIESDFLNKYPETRSDAPRKLFAALGYALEDFGTTEEESYTCGEGSVVTGFLYPELAAKMAARVAHLAEKFGVKTLAVASPYTKAVLAKALPGVKVVTPEEAFAR